MRDLLWGALVAIASIIGWKAHTIFLEYKAYCQEISELRLKVQIVEAENAEHRCRLLKLENSVSCPPARSGDKE